MAGAKPSAVTSDHLFSILSQFSDTKPPNFFERGPRYKAYADLRESKLRLKSMTNRSGSSISTPPENQVKFPASRRKAFSVLTQSVPDFSPVLRKENRKPSLPPVAEKSATPPAKSSSRLYEINAKLMGSKSMVSREKRHDGMMTARRSCANMDELKKFSMAAANAINGENKRGGRVARNRGGGRTTTVLGSRQYY
ncbi:hypothetical protein L1987_47066 [Smallanthus sonchifolius]|uniref:Uncharacterized protein n=1 Tax=Smallanthus sonchifolius TaxID=185202 RepID=A0ACB9G258_9ASTR|nr:hypothetical protein L1987_47066 [Smallanthus sonchifolius]